MVNLVLCLDTNVLVKYLTQEEPADSAIEIVVRANSDDVKLVAPAFAWAEVGSVLRKKVRTSLLTADEADNLWQRFFILPINFTDNQALRDRAWELAESYQLPTLYDAAFLACTEIAAASQGVPGEFWTADKVLLNSLGDTRPAYIRELGIDPIP